jgi:Acyl-CoA carboxylase epsilon subunit
VSDESERSSSENGSAAEPARPVLRIVRGDPTPEELAALLAVVGAKSGTGSGAAELPARSTRSAWSDPARLVRRPVRPGPDGWRRSALPG